MTQSVSRSTYDQVMMQVYCPLDMVLVRGRGVYLYDDQGREYLDLTAGIAVNALGHAHPGLCEVIARQAATLIHTSNIFVSDQTLRLALRLTALTGYDRVFFVNSGTEANETALKLARRSAYDEHGPAKDEIISFDRGFHGRTFFSVCVGGTPHYSEGFGPRPPAITHLPYNDCAALQRQVSERTCAVIMEPIQGEGGIIAADPAFVSLARELCDRHHAALIFDEVQTGMGRTGSLYAFEELGIRPDILTTSKALAGGIPCGAVLATEAQARHFTPGTHGSTFGGNPFACACACYAVDVISDPAFLAGVRERGAQLRAILERLGRSCGVFTEVRGRGLLLGCVLAAAHAGQAARLQQCCARHGVLVLTASPDVLRLTPPLIIGAADLERAAERLAAACDEFSRQSPAGADA